MSLVANVRKFHFGVLLKLQSMFCEDVLVLGDSHARVFARPLLRRRLWRHHLRVVAVPGATASGLENPDSKTQALPKFEAALAATKARRAIVLLGEIDVGFVIWYRAQKYTIPVSEALEHACATYGAFLLRVQELGIAPICVSAPLPTIEDGNDWGEVASLRRSIRATQRERTELTLRFNERVAAFCRAKNIAYIGLDEASTAPNGLVDPALLNPDPLDHHYNARAYAARLAAPVAELLRRPSGRLEALLPHPAKPASGVSRQATHSARRTPFSKAREVRDTRPR